MWGNKPEAATKAVYSIEKIASFSTVRSSSSSSSLSPCPLTCVSCRYSNNSPLCSPLGFWRAEIRVSRFWNVWFGGFLDSSPWRSIIPTTGIARYRGGEWRIRVSWCRRRLQDFLRRRLRVGGTMLTSQLSGRMGSSSLFVELMLLFPPLLLYDSKFLEISGWIFVWERISFQKRLIWGYRSNPCVFDLSFLFC